MKVYIVDIIGSYCGMHYYDIAFSDALNSRGYITKILSNFAEDGKAKKFFPNFLAFPKLIGFFLLLKAYLYFLFFIVTHKKDKIVYLSYGELYEIPFLLACSLSRKTIIDVHEVHALKYRDTSCISKLLEWIYRHYVHNIIYHSERTYNILKKDKIKMIFVPHFKYVFKKTYNEDMLSSDIIECFKNRNVKFLFFGNLSNVKGIHTVIDVFSKLPNDTNYELVIAGKNVENIDFSIFRNINNLVIDRHINDDELVYLYSNTDYVLLPYKRSSQSGVFAMAAYFRKPMILSDITYFRKMHSVYPSFGVIVSLDNYLETILKIIREPNGNFYSENDCDRFEMKEELNIFIKNLCKE